MARIQACMRATNDIFGEKMARRLCEEAVYGSRGTRRARSKSRRQTSRRRRTFRQNAIAAPEL